MLVIPPSHNIWDFEFLFATFDHSSYSKNFKIIIYFICDLLYYLIIYSTLSTIFCFLYLQK